LPAAGVVSAHVIDARGRELETLYQGPAGPGDLILRWDASGAPSGAYSVLLRSGAQSKRISAIVAR
jgi:hypothetical protein